jgi:hypothetical protein
MKYTFCEYAEKRKNLDNIFESIVIEAHNNEDLMRLLQEAGFWSGVANSGVGKFAQNLWNAGSSFIKGTARGVQTGADTAWSQMTGPATQLDYAISALNKALKAIENEPNWKNSQTTGQAGSLPSMSLVTWLKETIQELQNQKPQFSNKSLPDKAAASAQTQAAQPAPGVSPGTATSKF